MEFNIIKLMQEGERIMTICNSCRYCEGFCAVFPAMEERLTFEKGDLNYLANLCHNCGECYYACQYSPPHEFAVNVPQVLAQIRNESYEEYAWPKPLASVFKRNAVVTSLLIAAGISVGLVAAVATSAKSLWSVVPDGNFYQVFPHNTLATAFGVVSALVLCALVMGFLSFWKDAGENLGEFARPFALRSAVKDILKLEYLHGKGKGCTYPTQENSQARRWFHHLTFYGFMLCFAATSVATFFHYALHWEAPYALFSLPVALGTVGGIGLVIGPLGLLWLKFKRDPNTSDNRPSRVGMDVTFIMLLILVSVTGLALLGLRETALMTIALVVHLAFVMTLFMILPYGKFVHGLYRGAALVKYALERKRPGLNLGGD